VCALPRHRGLGASPPWIPRRGPHGKQSMKKFFLYDDGSIKKDETEAVKWLRLAAEQEHAEARYLLGQAYELGKGVEKDKAEAAKWYRLAARRP